ncbi:MAG: outer membrane protein assembly factor BamA, partial [Treponema sp.]|nr:outer membrane protein assembly factor BamA [Treponema sp.]
MSLKRSCLVLAFISIFALCGMNVYAQDSASTENTEWNYYGRKIRSVKFKGLTTVAEKDVDGITSSFIGHPFSDELFSDLCDRIYALDMFDDLEPQAVPGDSKKSTVTIVFTVKEKPVVRKITVTG